MKKTTTIVEENGKTTTTTVIENGKKPFYAQILIDDSGSMDGWQSKIVSGVNEYAQTLANKAKEEDIQATIGVTLFRSGPFDVGLRRLRPDININEFVPLNITEIRPNGGTALFDAIGDMVNFNMKHSKDHNTSLVILTDGEENSSKRYRSSMIKELLDKKQREDNWIVLYLGANQDAWVAGDSIGAFKGLVASYAMNNMDNALRASGSASARYMSSGVGASATFTEQERASMIDPKGAK